jgi:hypothetical protein
MPDNSRGGFSLEKQKVWMNNSKWFLTLLGGAALSLCALQAAAQEQRSLVMQERKTDVWLNAGFLSFHFDRSKHYREFNYGFGGEAILAPDHAVMAGVVKNSESETSHYIGYQYRPFHWQPASLDGVNVAAGLAVSLVDGYPTMSNKGWFIAPMPMVAVEGKKVGVNFILLPNIKHGGAVAMQLKLKIW